MSKDRSEPAPLPATEPNRTQQPATSSRADIEAFLGRLGALDPAVKAGQRGRLIFALDATMSRQPTWDQACVLQAEMFREAASVGGLDVQLVYYRGLAECRASIAAAVTPKLRKFSLTLGAKTIRLRSAPWSWSATPWKNRLMSCAPPPANSACAVFRRSCSQRAQMRVAH